MSAPHIPVMINEVLEFLDPVDGQTYIDGTFGRGGYSKAILNAADCRVEAIDRDPHAIEVGKMMENQYKSRFMIHQGCFGDLDQLVNLDSCDGVVLDVGVSSPQLDEAERGFSFQKDGPLDMRMSQDGPTAAEVVNTREESDLADIIYIYGEERKSRRVARAIVQERETNGPLETTFQLADAVRRVVRKDRSGIDPATRTFQALRLYVNDELNELERGLRAAERLLAPEGRLVVVSFHSLEDRIVKSFLNNRCCSHARGSRHFPSVELPMQPTFHIRHKKPVTARESEVAVNPRSRSAKLRWAIRTDAPAMEI